VEKRPRTVEKMRGGLKALLEGRRLSPAASPCCLRVTLVRKGTGPIERLKESYCHHQTVWPENCLIPPRADNVRRGEKKNR